MALRLKGHALLTDRKSEELKCSCDWDGQQTGLIWAVEWPHLPCSRLMTDTGYGWARQQLHPLTQLLALLLCLLCLLRPLRLLRLLRPLHPLRLLRLLRLLRRLCPLVNVQRQQLVMLYFQPLQCLSDTSQQLSSACGRVTNRRDSRGCDVLA